MNKGMSFISLIAVTAALSFQASAQDYQVPENTPLHIRQAIVVDTRTPEDTARDAGRLPAEVLTLTDLNQGDRIIELSSLGQYYSRMMAAAVGASGHVYMFDLPVWERFGAGESGSVFAAMHPNASHEMEDYDVADYPDNVDAAYNILSYHDLAMAGIDTAAMNAKLFNALRPGGQYIIIDHRAEDGSGLRDSESMHRADREHIINEVTDAGFELALDSSLLVNPADDHSVSAFAMSGATDRALLIFRKPES